MANKKITALPALGATPATDDVLPIVDVSGTATTKKVTVTNLMGQAPIQSVNSATGAVVLDADDISDASTTNKFVTATDITNLGNLSGTNTGDQDLSSYQLQPSEGAFVDGDKTKLDGIEASADVTDSTNVAAAGALMDSEVTNLAQVKAFDSSDYATAAQGAKADSATQPGDLGTSAALDVGTSATNVVQLNGSAQLPAVDGSLLTGVTSPFKDTITKTASFTLSNSDSGKVIKCDLGSRIDITIPAGLTLGFNCRVVQKGVGRVRFLTDATTTLNSYYSSGSEPNAVIGRYGVVDLVNTATNAYHLSGDYEYLFVYTNNWSNAFDGGSSQEFRTSALSRPSGSWSNNVPYTLSAWVKPNSTGGDGGVIGFLPFTSSQSSAAYVGSYFATSGTRYAWYQGNENFSGYTFTSGQWDHLVQIWDGSNLKGYINGVLKISVSKANNGFGTSGTLAIHGSSRGRWNDRAPINIDEVSVWDSALSDGGVSVGQTATGQIATLYNSGTPSDLTSLSPIGWWLMGDSQVGQTDGGTTPTTITDVGIGSHTKADGTLFGSATYSNQTP